MYPHIFIIFLAFNTAYQECTKPINLEISCTSFLDLQNLDVNFRNVTIISDAHKLDIRQQTAVSQPTLQLSLTDEGNTISASKLTKLNELNKTIFGGSPIETITSTLFSSSQFKIIKWNRGEISNIELGAFSHSNNLTEVSITNHKLTTVKYGIFNGLTVQILALSGNQIGFVERNAFIDMVNLKSLYLDHNDLMEFQPEILFNHGETLENLYLNGNSLTDFDRNMVRGLSNLRVLNLAYNKISRIFRYTFDYLTKLERLSLSHNLLVELDGFIFPDNGLSSLSTLHISHNRLSFLTSTALEKLTGLTELSIGGNPWQCSCYEILSVWLGDHNIVQVCDEEYSDGSRPVCMDLSHSTCLYNVTLFNHNKYIETDNAIPLRRKCKL